MSIIFQDTRKHPLQVWDRDNVQPEDIGMTQVEMSHCTHGLVSKTQPQSQVPLTRGSVRPRWEGIHGQPLGQAQDGAGAFPGPPLTSDILKDGM